MLTIFCFQALGYDGFGVHSRQYGHGAKSKTKSESKDFSYS